MTVVTHMPAAAVLLVGEHDTRCWHLVIHYVEAALARLIRRTSVAGDSFGSTP